MFISELSTSNPRVRLISPDVKRDAPLSVTWLEGDNGRETLRLMGIPSKDNHPTTLSAERRRVQDFLEKENQYNWMIESSGRVIGSIWVDLHSTAHLEAPAVHIMIGAPDDRGAGAGTAAFAAAIDYLRALGHSCIYSRHTLENTASASMQIKLGFTAQGEPYEDEDGLHYQNRVLEA